MQVCSALLLGLLERESVADDDVMVVTILSIFVNSLISSACIY